MSSVRRTRARDDGSVALTMLVLMVVTIMVTQFLLLSTGALRVSRRAGDSANALQVADAGVNAAVKAINAELAINPNVTAFTATSDLGAVGSYRYTVMKDGDLWRIDAIGSDRTGVQRRIVADAVDQPLFNNAFFALTSTRIRGTADSFESPARTCLTAASTPKAAGYMGSNGTITFEANLGSGSSGFNCQNAASPSWRAAADGCIFYETATAPLTDANGQPTIRAGGCPAAPLTLATVTRFRPRTPQIPAGTPLLGTSVGWTCPPGGTIPSGVWRTANLTLSNGCKVPNGQTSVIYVTGPVTIGAGTGSCNNVVNQPPGSDPCSGSNTPPSWYRTGWAKSLQIHVVPTSGASHTVTFAQHSRFWGLVLAPDAVVTTGAGSGGGGSPHAEIWGSVVARSANSAAQFKFHYDVTLATAVRTSQFVVTNWREEPLPQPVP